MNYFFKKEKCRSIIYISKKDSIGLKSIDKLYYEYYIRKPKANEIYLVYLDINENDDTRSVSSIGTDRRTKKDKNERKFNIFIKIVSLKDYYNSLED